jgi:hypothetical protein
LGSIFLGLIPQVLLSSLGIFVHRPYGAPAHTLDAATTATATAAAAATKEPAYSAYCTARWAKIRQCSTADFFGKINYTTHISLLYPWSAQHLDVQTREA